MTEHSFLPLTHRPFQKVLIANRGEIAMRIIRACRDLELTPLAIYSEADVHSMHVALADGAACVGPGPSIDSYLNIKNIIYAAKELGAEAVHPGFGFLSENALFANEVLKAGMVWIGPSPEAIHAMGDKTMAKRLVAQAGVPCSPGKNEPLKNIEELKEVAAKIGYPLILKAAAGGGGRGMRVVRHNNDLEGSFQACEREAQSYFNCPDVFCERYIEEPRHVEFQILADSHGHIVHLFERDCTIQRRHQKLIEEAPSSYLSEDVRYQMGAIAIKAAKSVGYVNAGTVEFIMESPTQFYFMEMNTRIQVEHPVTECLTGVDLVQMQLKIAQGEELPFAQKDLSIRGWAIEARINAENPYANFTPDVGTITYLNFPAGPGVRIDSHIYSGYRIPQFYDSMIGKLIVYGTCRTDAIQKLKRALSEMVVEGIHTTIPYHQALLRHPDFLSGSYTTRFMEQNPNVLQEFQQKLNPLTEEQAVLCVLSCPEVQGIPNLAQEEIIPGPWSEAHRLEGTRRVGR